MKTKIKYKMNCAFDTYYRNLSGDAKCFLTHIFACKEVAKNTFYFSMKHYVEVTANAHYLDDIIDTIKSANRAFNNLKTSSVEFEYKKHWTCRRVVGRYSTRDAMLVEIEIDEDFAEWYFKNIKGEYNGN